MFVVKEMTLAEWPVLQDKFSDLQMVLGAPEDFALFHRIHNGIQVSTIAASMIDIRRMDDLSPGGWSKVPKLEGDGWSVLVGTAGVEKRLGVRIGKPTDG